MTKDPFNNRKPELWKIVCDRIADIIIGIVVLVGIVLYVLFHTPGMFLNR